MKDKKTNVINDPKTRKIGEVKIYYSEDSDLGESFVSYGQDDKWNLTIVTDDDNDGFPEALESGEENTRMAAIYKLVNGKMVFHLGSFKSTLSNGSKRSGTLNEEEFSFHLLMLGLDRFDTISIIEDIELSKEEKLALMSLDELEQERLKSEVEENWEWAVVVRDMISNKKENE